jgi:murein DD-endopeptidase MepM/ murein hydrolase activator NlpD
MISSVCPVPGRLVASREPVTRRRDDRRRPQTTRPRRPRTIALALAAGVLGVTAIVASLPASAGTKEQLDEAKRDLQAMQAQLGRATAEWQAAERDLELTRGEVRAAKAEIDRLQRSVDRLGQRLERRAVVAFQSGAGSTIDLLLSSESFADFSARLEFLGSMSQADSDLLVERDVTEEELKRERDDLLQLETRQEEESLALEAAANRIESSLSEIQRRVNELTDKYRKELSAQRAAQRELQVLGQTPAPGGALGGAIQVCPVAGPNSFVDSFGWPRVGHTHQGIDLISPAGTPVVAAHAGVVSHSSSSSGGIQAYVRASSGTYTFYAHLSGYSAASGSVGAGTVIGYVGSTGNAGSTNHLHFEYHPGGGAAINPYQMLLAVC